MPERDDLLSELHSALAHLDDPPYLERHPLASRLSFVAQAPELSRGQALRRALRLAIAALDPGTGSSGLQARCYQVLYRWAVARQGMVGIAASLGISQRQAYRDLRYAIEALAQVLGGLGLAVGQGPEALGQGAALRLGQLQDELQRLASATDKDVDLGRLVSEVVENARYLARDSGVTIRLQVEAQGLQVAGNRVMLRQAILNLLSHIVSTQPGGTVEVDVCRCGPEAIVRITCQQSPTSPASHPPKSPYAVASQLLASLGIPREEEPAGQGTRRTSIRIPLAQERTVLIVDDNEGLIALFRRYLRHQPYRICSVSSGDEALAVLPELQPDVVILDVMMPDRDGWEVLQMLRATEAGRRARLIVCSIIDDPRLALALGADGFLNKPVDRTGLLQALADVLSSST